MKERGITIEEFRKEAKNGLKSTKEKAMVNV